MPACQLAHREKVGRRDGDSAADVVGVFQEYSPAAGKVGVVRPHRPFNVCHHHRPIGLIGEGMRIDASQRGDAASFVSEGVGLVAQDNLVPPPAVGQDRRQVGHRPTGDKESGLHADQIGRHLLQPDDCGVVAPHIIAHLCARHRLPHGESGPGNRVRTKINAFHLCPALSLLLPATVGHDTPEQAQTVEKLIFLPPPPSVVSTETR